MDNRRWQAIAPLLGAILLSLWVYTGALHTTAQEEGAQVQIAECDVSMPASAMDSTAFAFRVDVTTASDAGQFATISLCAQTADGWTQLTACDGAAVQCLPLTLRMEDAVQGESLIASIEAP